MITPIQIGLPQVILFVVAVIGLGLVISSGASLLRWGRYASHEDEEEGRGFLRRRRRRYFRWRRGVGGVVLLLLAVSLLWLTFVIQSYLGLTGEIKVAHVRASAVANAAHVLSVELILYDSDGHARSDNTYQINGDEWMVQGDIVKFPAWLNFLGLHAGYKLTRLEGRYDDIRLENTAAHTAVELNGGDDTFFKTAFAQRSWLSWFADAAYGNAVFQSTGTFDVFATQDALIARPVS